MKTPTQEIIDAKNTAYSERNNLVAFLSTVFESHTKLHPMEDKEWEDDWRTIICVHSPVGQMTWHIHDSEKEKFNHLEPAICEWDGHTTEEKYKRLKALTQHTTNTLKRKAEEIEKILKEAELQAESRVLTQFDEWFVDGTKSCTKYIRQRLSGFDKELKV